MKNFKAIVGSIFPNMLNKRFRAITEAITVLEDRLDALETSGESVIADDSPVTETAVDAAPVADDPVDPEPTDDQIREQAKDKGIKSWHVKAIDTLKTELAELEA
jgi:hypothetical protein